MQVGATPVAENLQHGDEFLTGGVQRVGDLRRDGCGCAAQDQTVFFELAQLFGEHFFGDSFQFSANFRETSWPEGKMPENLHLPLARDEVNGCLDWTPVMVLHSFAP